MLRSVRDQCNLVLLPRQLWCYVEESEFGETCHEVGWLCDDGRAVTSRCIFSNEVKLKASSVIQLLDVFKFVILTSCQLLITNAKGGQPCEPLTVITCFMSSIQNSMLRPLQCRPHQVMIRFNQKLVFQPSLFFILLGVVGSGINKTSWKTRFLVVAILYKV